MKYKKWKQQKASGKYIFHKNLKIAYKIVHENPSFPFAQIGVQV